MATVKEIRKQKNLSQGKLAAAAHVGRTTIYRLEQGEPVNQATLDAVARVLKVKVSDISGANVLDRSRRDVL